MSDSLKPTGYCIKTYRMLLSTEHPEWLKENQKRFHDVQHFYCEVLQKCPHLYQLGSQQILRELELMTISSANNPNVEMQIPWEKLPAYFRRAAINSVIGDLKSMFTRSNGQVLSLNTQSSAVFYQRMYRDFTKKKITLHVWNGEKWVWLNCRLFGNELPDLDEDGVKWMSPTVVIEDKQIFLNVPVRLPVNDARKLKQRIADGENICAVQYLNRKSFAVACILDKDGNQIAVHYIKGASQYVHQCKIQLDRIERSEKSGGTNNQPKANHKYWMKLKHLNEYWAHKASREILDFCLEHGAKVLTWEEYEENYSRAVLHSAGNWSALHLSSRIKEYLSYKAWGEGIVLAPVKSFQIKERKFADGDKGLQRARIVGRQCLQNF